MKHQYIKLLIVLIPFLLSGPPAVSANQVRKPVYAGSFYPQNPKELTSLIDRYTKLAQQSPVDLPSGATLRALILPHAGYIYSGPVAAYSSNVLSNKHFDKIIIMGPDHRVGFKNCAVSDVSAYKTPLGMVAIHPDANRLRNRFPEIFRFVPSSDAKEHDIEVQLPFLQRYLKNFSMIPVVMGPGDLDKYTRAVDTITDLNTLIVVSSDLSHYSPYDQAVIADHETIRQILRLDLEKLAANKYGACGIIPIRVLVRMAIRHRWTPILLHYANSGDTAGNKNRVVGYAAIAFYEPSANKLEKGNILMDKEKGDILLKLARKTIAHSLKQTTADSDELAKALSDKAFNDRRGTFVTLKINNQLRGCIGNLSADKSIVEGVKDNAINAAFHDPRFPPLSSRELEAVDIEISLLSEPQPLEYSDGQDLLQKLRPNIDGVIIRKGLYSATFLPQVWEQLPDKVSFLSHLCRKAGLSPDEWRHPGLDVMVYQVQYFEEEH